MGSERQGYWFRQTDSDLYGLAVPRPSDRCCRTFGDHQILRD
jgi:hypothetical protein